MITVSLMMINVRVVVTPALFLVYPAQDPHGHMPSPAHTVPSHADHPVSSAAAVHYSMWNPGSLEVSLGKKILFPTRVSPSVRDIHILATCHASCRLMIPESVSRREG